MQAWSQNLKLAYNKATLDIRVDRVQVFSLLKKMYICEHGYQAKM